MTPQENPQPRDPLRTGGLLMAALADHVREDRLVGSWSVREHNEARQRFYRRLGATLRTKTVTSWQPRGYEAYSAAAAGAARTSPGDAAASR